jgi:hypothetical protein
MGWFSKLTGETVNYEDGTKTTLSADGVSVEPDAAFSRADMDAYRKGEISDVEYRARYNRRFVGED